MIKQNAPQDQSAHAWQPLKAGDSIMLAAPSRALQKDAYGQIKKMFEDWGLNVVIPHDMLPPEGYYQWPTTPQSRADQIMNGLKDPSIKAIFCLEGGEGALEVVQLIKQQEGDLAQITGAKPIIGYSDIGQLHSYLGQRGFASPVYGPTIEYLADLKGHQDFQAVTDQQTLDTLSHNQEQLKQFLMGDGAQTTPVSLTPLNDTARQSQILTGLSIMPNLMADNSSHRLEFLPEQKYVVYLEGRTGESIRLKLQNLRQRGLLPQVEAFVIGRYVDNQEHQGTLQEASVQGLQHIFQEEDIQTPTFFGAPYGHAKWGLNNATISPFPLHVPTRITSDSGQATLVSDRFRSMAEVKASNALVPHPALGNSAFGHTLPQPCELTHQVTLTPQYQPDLAPILHVDTRQASLSMDFGAHFDINTVHIALSELLAAGKLNDLKSLEISGDTPSAQVESWLKDFQQQHLPNVSMTVKQKRALLEDEKPIPLIKASSVRSEELGHMGRPLTPITINSREDSDTRSRT